jgi:argonaute-like protein implicated in RNA metabolism and viral defense
VKAYAVQTGVSTQFLREDTLTDPSSCRVWWWLSIALYAKSMRTPWVLDALDPDTAFVGLGFSINTKAKRGEQVVLGCSHLYNSRGEGLQFRLGKIENPVIIKGNPFMSKEDARRTGETIRQLFFDARRKLPKRVVLHKLTPFKKDEREGLMEGLEGVDEIEMIEVYVDNALRYVSSVVSENGKFGPDGYPIRRGSVLKLDDHTALLWVHGVTDAVKPNWRYYQGKRRIPSPMVIKRHSGRSDLRLVAQELLGLSKMDLNSGDMYARLPATVFSSRSIARIGSLLKPTSAISYDYRLFI